MNDILTDALAVIGVVLNGLPQGLLALAYGFASVPTALAFFVGVIGNTITQSVAPISFQAETITYAGTAGKNRAERCAMIFLGGVIMTIIGAFGLLTKIVDFIGEDVSYGMMAGVGIILTKAAIDMIRKDAISGGVSLAAALITYFFTRDSSNALVYTIVISVVASCIASAIFKKEKANIVVENDGFVRQKFTINSSVIIGALGMVCLNIGSNISFGGITAGHQRQLQRRPPHGDFLRGRYGFLVLRRSAGGIHHFRHGQRAAPGVGGRDHDGDHRPDSGVQAAAQNRQIRALFFHRGLLVRAGPVQHRRAGRAPRAGGKPRGWRRGHGRHRRHQPVPRHARRGCGEALGPVTPKRKRREEP